MKLHRLRLDVLSGFRHLQSLPRSGALPDKASFALAQRRAEEVFQEFERSPEAAALPSGTRWSGLLMRVAYDMHSVAIDDVNREILRDVANRLVIANDMSSLSMWVAVIHDELVAFFRFLDRKGFAHAARCVCALENEILPKHDAMLNEAACAAAEACAL